MRDGGDSDGLMEVSSYCQVLEMVGDDGREFEVMFKSRWRERAVMVGRNIVSGPKG